MKAVVGIEFVATIERCQVISLGLDGLNSRTSLEAVEKKMLDFLIEAHGSALGITPYTLMVASFFQKPIGALTVLGTAVGAPYAIYETDAGTTARVAMMQLMDPSQGTAQPDQAQPGGPPLSHSMLAAGNSGSPPAPWGPPPSATAPMNVPGTTISYGPATITPIPNQAGVPGAVPQGAGTTAPPPISDVREVIRFDMTPTYLIQRFGRVSTVQANPQFDGMRVALVTGTQPFDIAGTLTYFFDANRAVQRIQFYGTTGDPTMIAGMMTQFYRLQPEPSLGGQLFTSRWNNRVTSMLRIAPAAVIQTGTSNANYLVFLELNQPSPAYGLSDEATHYAATLPSQRPQ